MSKDKGKTKEEKRMPAGLKMQTSIKAISNH